MVILLSGFAGSGKDTLAAPMIKELGYTRIALADALKDEVAEQYGISRQSLDDRILKESPILHLPVLSKDGFSRMIHEKMFREFRTMDGERPTAFVYGENNEMLMAVSTSEGDVIITGRQLYQTPRSLAILTGSVKRSVNPNYWVEKALAPVLQNPTGRFVVTDFRYQSEYEGITKVLGADAVKTIRISRFETTQSTDPSERDLDSFKFDHILENKTDQETYIKIGLALIESLSATKEGEINPSLWV